MGKSNNMENLISVVEQIDELGKVRKLSGNKYLFGVFKKYGLAIVPNHTGDGFGCLDNETLDDIFEEVYQNGLKTPVRIYAKNTTVVIDHRDINFKKME